MVEQARAGAGPLDDALKRDDIDESGLSRPHAGVTSTAASPYSTSVYA
jgi:hypothetical protein